MCSPSAPALKMRKKKSSRTQTTATGGEPAHAQPQENLPEPLGGEQKCFRQLILFLMI